MAPAENLTPKRVPAQSGAKVSRPTSSAPIRQNSKLVIEGVAKMVMANPLFRGTAADAEEIGKAEVNKRTGQIQDFIKAYGSVVEGDGGWLRLVSFDVAKGTARVELSGSCSTCALSDETLYRNLRAALKKLQTQDKALLWLHEIQGDTLELSDRSSMAASVQQGARHYQPREGLIRSLGLTMGPTQ